MARKKGTRITLEDVAENAGVSAMTVSRVINQKGRISEQTRQRVLKIVDQLGYRPNRVAQTLVTAKTQMVAFVVPDITNPYFSQIFLGLDDILNREEYSVLVMNSNENPEREKKLLRDLDDSMIDGLVLCSSRLPDDDLLPLLSRFPAIVSVSRRLPENLASAVRSDYVPGYRAVAAYEYLHSLGYERIAYLPLEHFALYVNVDDFQRELSRVGVRIKPEWFRSSAPGWQAGYDTAYELLQEHPELQAIVGGNDLVSLGAMRAAINLGRKIPDDLGIVGADDILLASQVTPALTTLRTDSYRMGIMAAKLLFPRMEGDMTYREHVYSTSLIVRDSTRPLNAERS